jgi:adenylate cyclase
MEKRADLISYQFGEWRVEPSLNRIVRDESAFHVEPRTLSVLTYLLDRPGRVVSVDEMLDEVWPGRIVEPNAIQRHIARIRHLLDDDAHNPRYVETISKRGYRAIAPVRRKAHSLTQEVVPLSSPINGRTTETISSSGVLPHSIAVLPFVSLSPDPDHAFFAAGIHEEILHRLAKIKGLSVIARTTMLRYANTQLSIPEIGSEVKVQTVMEGSVRYAGNRVRITVQLIEARSGIHLWSEAYDENLEDIFAVQSAIASRIARSLDLELSVSEKQRIGLRATESPEAHAFYLKALSLWGNLTATAPVREALDAAMSIDPAFSAAIAFKAWIRATEACFHSRFGMEGFAADDQEALISEAELLAHRALALNDSETLARLALSTVYLHDRRWQAAREVFDRIPTPPDGKMLRRVGAPVTRTTMR